MANKSLGAGKGEWRYKNHYGQPHTGNRWVQILSSHSGFSLSLPFHDRSAAYYRRGSGGTRKRLNQLLAHGSTSTIFFLTEVWGGTAKARQDKQQRPFVPDNKRKRHTEIKFWDQVILSSIVVPMRPSQPPLTWIMFLYFFFLCGYKQWSPRYIYTSPFWKQSPRLIQTVNYIICQVLRLST